MPVANPAVVASVMYVDPVFPRRVARRNVAVVDVPVVVMYPRARTRICRPDSHPW